MDDFKQSAEAAGLPVQGPHLHSGFIPMRLLLQPSGMTVEVTKPDWLVGRHSETDLRLPLPDVSRRHCRFVFNGSHWEVVDQNSLNGVFVNGKRVQRARLQQGDMIRVGGFTFTVDLQAGPRAVPLTIPSAA